MKHFKQSVQRGLRFWRNLMKSLEEKTRVVELCRVGVASVSVSQVWFFTHDAISQKISLNSLDLYLAKNATKKPGYKYSDK